MAVSDENGVLYAEVPMGSYTISDDADEEHLLLALLDVEEDDITTTLTYAASTWLNGSVDAPFGADNGYDAWLETESDRPRPPPKSTWSQGAQVT